MGFKLVRIDATEPCKIPLPVGTHYIGRGMFLNCDDHRVSRMHGLLDVSTDTVKIKALHPNPCFYKRNQNAQLFVLNQGEVTDLTNGAQFGLVPDSYWYEVIYCHEMTERPSPPDNEKVPEKPDTVGQTNSNVDCSNDTQRYKLDEEIKNEVNAMSRDITSPDSDGTACEEGDRNDSAHLHLEFEDSMDEGHVGSESPSLIPREDNPVTSPPKEAAGQAEADPISPNKRAHSPEPTLDDSAEKKIKTEAESPKIEPGSNDVNAQQNNALDIAGPSRDPGPSNADGNNNAPLPKQAAGPARERCIYGAKCYRLNPQHKAQFSHPADPDYGLGEKGECPYGAACLRRDPRHWDTHDHPPGARAAPDPPAPRPGKRAKKPRVVEHSESEEEEVSPADLILDGKRKRKPVQIVRWSGSEEEPEDPYATDESDEWEPSTDVTGSASQSQDF